MSPRPADASEEKGTFSPWNCVWKKSSASVPSRARTETASLARPDVPASAQTSTTSAAAQGASRPAAVTCHRDLGFFSAEASAVTPTSLARGSGARAPPALGNSARVSPIDIAAAAVTSREVEDQGRDAARDGMADTNAHSLRSSRVLLTVERILFFPFL